MFRPEDAERARKITLRDVACDRAPSAELAQPPVPRAQRAGEAAPSAARRPCIAVLAVHGMGEQVQFETLEQVATALCAADGQFIPQVTATNMAFDREHTAERLDIVLHGKDGKAAADVHLYEAYWAPLTEGTVKLHEVFRFLVRGAWRSLFAARRPFLRWIFQDTVDFGTQRHAFWGLFVAAIMLLNLAVLNVIIPGMAGALFTNTVLPFQLTARSIAVMTFCSDLLLAALGLALGVLWVAYLLKRDYPRARKLRRGVSSLGLMFLVLGTLALMLFPAVLVLLWWLQPQPMSLLGSDLFLFLTTKTSIAMTWGVLVVVTLRIRYFLVEYVGDVAAYINPQTLDRFSELRQKVKEAVCVPARMILGYRPPGESAWLYDSIAVVGHSLGSVIAYDVVNQLFMDDVLKGAALQSRDRIRTLLTFGSPLNKTAFIFGLHGKDTHDIRELLAARVQPLVEDYANRTNLAWINVYSWFDIISGRLRFYDRLKNPLFPVRNVRDEDATIPLAAHTEYWTDPLVWRLLHAELVRATAPE